MPKKKMKLNVDERTYRIIYARGYDTGRKKGKREQEEKSLRIAYLEEALARVGKFLSSL